MRKQKNKKIGKHFFLAFFLGIVPAIAAGADAEFHAKVDQNQVSEFESVELKLTIITEGNQRIEDLRYSAPQFQELSQSENSFFQTIYENGQIMVKNRKSITLILKPKQKGNLKIDQLSVKVAGKLLTAPPITVSVQNGGRPPVVRHHEENEKNMQNVPRTTGFFLRAEVDKDKVYKGEGIIVSFYLYRKTQVSLQSVDKYPAFPGFIKQELDMSILKPMQNWEWKDVRVNGELYKRALLAKYLAYPLKEGRSQIDIMEITGLYYSRQNRPAGGDEEDFFGMNSFFQMVTPLKGIARSEVVPIQVQPLPQQGRPSDFSDAVGQFSLQATLDSKEVKVNEAVTYRVTVQGKGSLQSSKEMKLSLDPNLEVYDAKSKDQVLPGGTGEVLKTTDYLIIPRKEGHYTIPSQDWVYFDPKKGTYQKLQTPALSFQVIANPNQSHAATKQEAWVPQTQAQNTPQFWEQHRELILKILKGVVVLLSLAAGFLLMRRFWSRYRMNAQARIREKALKKNQESKSWQSLLKFSNSKEFQTPEGVMKGYDLLTGSIYDWLDNKYQISSRSMPWYELSQKLEAEKGLSEFLKAFFEYSEQVRYGLSLNIVSIQSARQEFPIWIEKFRKLQSV